jgi:hypothetical protein
LYRGDNYVASKRETWIKVETVDVNGANVTTNDVTEAFLSLGLTEKAPGTLLLQNSGADEHTIIRLQRFAISGPKIREIITKVAGEDIYTYLPLGLNDGLSYVVANSSDPLFPKNYTIDNEKLNNASSSLIGSNVELVPFPIETFDAHEGLYNETLKVENIYKDAFGRTVPWIGVMSLVEIDIGNFKKLVEHTHDGKFPAGTLPGGATDLIIPTSDDGYIIYVSDRRGDRDNDGEFDMENIYVEKNNPNANNTFERAGEDINGNNVFDVDYDWEASRYIAQGAWTNSDDPVQIVNPSGSTRFATAPTDLAALFDHKYNRRAVRLVNGPVLPGDEGNGLTIASENGVYIQGNYNARSVHARPSSYGGRPTPSIDYCPNSDPSSNCGVSIERQVPASVAADAVTLLSNSWKDGRIFNDPFHRDSLLPTATETTYRMGVITGMTLEFLYEGASDGGHPNQGADHERMNGSMHEGMLRYLEYWGPPRYEYSTNRYLNFSGSLIHLYNSCNMNGSWKIGLGNAGSNPADFDFHVFVPPSFNRTFERTFLNPERVPPGTPFIQYSTLTGFRQTNE